MPEIDVNKAVDATFNALIFFSGDAYRKESPSDPLSMLTISDHGLRIRGGEGEKPDILAMREVVKGFMGDIDRRVDPNVREAALNHASFTLASVLCQNLILPLELCKFPGFKVNRQQYGRPAEIDISPESRAQFAEMVRDERGLDGEVLMREPGNLLFKRNILVQASLRERYLEIGNNPQKFSRILDAVDREVTRKMSALAVAAKANDVFGAAIDGAFNGQNGAPLIPSGGVGRRIAEFYLSKPGSRNSENELSDRGNGVISAILLKKAASDSAKTKVQEIAERRNSSTAEGPDISRLHI